MSFISRIKPPMWALTPGLVDPKWRWFWKDALSVLVFWEGGGPPYDLVRRKLATIVNTPIWSVNELGPAGETDATSDYWHLGDSSLILPTARCTMAFISEKTDATDRASSALGPVTTATNQRCGGHFPFSNGNYIFDFGGTANGASRVTIASPAFAGPRKIVLRGGSRGMAVWENGVELASHASAITRSATTTDLQINQGHGAGGDLAKYSMVGFFDAEWGDGQIEQWSADPFGAIRMMDEAGVVYALPAVGGVVVPIFDHHYRSMRAA